VMIITLFEYKIAKYFSSLSLTSLDCNFSFIG
jgi:hypothetical protein